MKRLLLISGLLIAGFTSRAQQDSVHAGIIPAVDSSFARGHATVLMLDSAVGNVISQSEKIAYHLFPYIPYQEFHTAEFFRLPDNSIVLVIQKSDSTTKIINYTPADYRSSAYLVQYYSGKIKPADDLTPQATYYILKSSFDLLDIFIRSKSNCK